MGMYIMNGETFLKTYIQKEDPDIVLRTQYVLVSSMLRKGGRYEKQVISASGVLFPPSMMVVDYEDYEDPDYEARYLEYLHETARPFLATIISFALDHEENVVILCSKKEWKYRYLKLLQKFVLEEFGYHINDYKKMKKGKEKVVEDDEALVASVCRKILKKAKKERVQNQKMTDKGRETYVHELSKGDLIRKLKNRNLYIKGMGKSEMMDTLLTFL